MSTDILIMSTLLPAAPSGRERSEWRTEQVKASRKLRELIATAAPVVAPGAYDGLSARLVEQAGFPAVYITGGGLARSMGIPDRGLMSLTEIVGRPESIVARGDIPVLGDEDTWPGQALTETGN